MKKKEGKLILKTSAEKRGKIDRGLEWRPPDFLFCFITHYTNFRQHIPSPTAQAEIGAREPLSEFILWWQYSTGLEGNGFIYLYLYLSIIYLSVIYLVCMYHLSIHLCYLCMYLCI